MDDEKFPVTCKKVDPEVLRSGKGLDEALRQAETTEVAQSVFTARREKLIERERARHRPKRR
jgi:hypothetical protein